jgi:hypothetical protein
VDLEVSRNLSAAGLNVDMDDRAPLPTIRLDQGSGDPLPPEQDGLITVRSGNATCQVTLEPIGRLFTGEARAPDLSNSPEPYETFLAVFELTAANYCAATQRVPTDDEFARLYKLLRNKPDGWDRNPLFGYLQAAAKVYLSLRDVSRHEFRAVVGRLAKSAKTFRLSKRSCNYYANALGSLHPDLAATLALD